jgi:hypothetical protein
MQTGAWPIGFAVAAVGAGVNAGLLADDPVRAWNWGVLVLCALVALYLAVDGRR